MSSHPLTRVAGIGEKTEVLLRSLKITNCGELANAKPGSVQVSNIGKLIEAAKAYVAQHDSGPSVVTIGAYGRSETKEMREQKDLVRYLITDHTWWESKVSVPHPSSTPENRKFQEAIIWDLLIDPNHRISMNCTWLEEDQTETSFEFSPILLRHFNPTLPELRVELNPQDAKSIPFHALVNVLWECDQLMS